LKVEESQYQGHPPRIGGEMVKAPDFSPGEPAIEKRALALVIP
jgi:hypothetical protein